MPEKAAIEKKKTLKLFGVTSAFIGRCLRLFQLKYFEDESTLKELHSQECCVGCRIRELPETLNTENICSILQCVNILSKLGKSKEENQRRSLVKFMAKKSTGYGHTSINKILLLKISLLFVC